MAPQDQTCTATISPTPLPVPQVSSSLAPMDSETTTVDPLVDPGPLPDP